MVYLLAERLVRWLPVPTWSIKTIINGGTWVAQSIEHPALDFSSGHDPRVVGSSPTLGSVVGMEPAFEILFPSPSSRLPQLCALSLSLSNKKKKHN